MNLEPTLQWNTPLRFPQEWVRATSHKIDTMPLLGHFPMPSATNNAPNIVGLMFWRSASAGMALGSKALVLVWAVIVYRKGTGDPSCQVEKNAVQRKPNRQRKQKPKHRNSLLAMLLAIMIIHGNLGHPSRLRCIATQIRKAHRFLPSLAEADHQISVFLQMPWNCFWRRNGRSTLQLSWIKSRVCWYETIHRTNLAQAWKIENTVMLQMRRHHVKHTCYASNTKKNVKRAIQWKKQRGGFKGKGKSWEEWNQFLPYCKSIYPTKRLERSQNLMANKRLMFKMTHMSQQPTMSTEQLNFNDVLEENRNTLC